MRIRVGILSRELHDVAYGFPSKPPPMDLLPLKRPKTGPHSPEVLLALLSDESPRVYGPVRRHLLKLGKAAYPALRRATRSEDPVLRTRAREILLEHKREYAARKLVRYALQPQHSLSGAIGRLDQFIDPELDPRPYQLAVTAMGDEVRKRLRRRSSEPAEVLSEYLFGERGFTGTDDEAPMPGHASMARTIDTRRGMPLVLCALYSAVAEEAEVKVDLLPVPGHVVAMVHQESKDQIIDPFGNGELIERKHIMGYLEANQLPLQDEWLTPAPSTAMFLRHTLNTAACFRAVGRPGEVRRLARVAKVLARHHSTPKFAV